MKKMKSYQVFLEDKKVEVPDSVKHNIIKFLISQERKSGIYFSNFDLIEDDNGREKFIIAYTQEGPKHEKPPVDKVVFDIYDYYMWGLEEKYDKGDYDFDNTWGNPRVKTLDQAKKELKSNILRQIVQLDPREKLTEPSEDDKKLIDKIIGQSDVWNTCKKRVKEILDVINKYDIEDVEDRLVEFSDLLVEWKTKVMFAWNYKSSWHGLRNNEDLDDQTCRFILDLWYEMNKPYEGSQYKEFLLMARPCIYINFEDESGRNPKKLSEVEPIGFRIGKRFEQLYDVEKVIYPYYSNSRRFDDGNIGDYQMTIILK